METRVFKIRYRNGAEEFVHTDAKDIEDQANRTFGLTLQEMQDFGAAVEIMPEGFKIGDAIPPKEVDKNLDKEEDAVALQQTKTEDAAKAEAAAVNPANAEPPKDNNTDPYAQSAVTHGMTANGIVDILSPEGSTSMETTEPAQPDSGLKTVNGKPVINPFAHNIPKDATSSEVKPATMVETVTPSAPAPAAAKAKKTAIAKAPEALVTATVPAVPQEAPDRVVHIERAVDEKSKPSTGE